MMPTPRPGTVAGVRPAVRVIVDGTPYAAEEIARGAAYELLSPYEVAGFTEGPRGWRRFVHASEVTAVGDRPPAPDDALDAPLQVPLSRTRTWADVHRLTQSPALAESAALLSIRRTALVRRGSRMVKVLSARQLDACLGGWPPGGFCYREYDIAHLRTPAELRLLQADPDPAGADDVAFALRWRAVDGGDYAVPSTAEQPGLVQMPPHDRVGPPVLGTGFTPSAEHVIPEFVTADLADVPLPAHAVLLAYLPDGTEVTLFTYQPEQRGWLRMAGPRWRHLLRGAGGAGIDQEYVPIAPATAGTSRLVGWCGDQQYDAVADPPDEFRVLSMTRAARFPVDALARRTRYATWRGVRCTVVRDEREWVRVRLCRPDPERVSALGARCQERGVYETWAPAAELTSRVAVDHPYALPTRS